MAYTVKLLRKSHLKDYRDVPEARYSLGPYFLFYNDQRISSIVGLSHAPKACISVP